MRAQTEGTVKTVKAVEDLTEEELETLLTGRRLSREQQLLSEGERSDARAVQASDSSGLGDPSLRCHLTCRA